MGAPFVLSGPSSAGTTLYCWSVIDVARTAASRRAWGSRKRSGRSASAFKQVAASLQHQACLLPVRE